MSFPNSRAGSDHFANIQSLNALPTDFHESAPTDPDLSLFTNTEFFDWDVAGAEQQQQFDPLSAQASDAGFNNTFPFNDLSFPQQPQSQLQPASQDVKWQQQPATSDASSPWASSPTTTQAPRRRTESSAARSAANAPAADEESPADPLNVSAEEDKRRRNTAASARFRVKKKQREQAMEKTAKEMTERVASLEAKIGELEKENKLLKGLLTEKGDGETSRKRLKTEA